MALFGMFSSDDAPTWKELSALKRGGGEYQSLFSWQAEEYRRQGRRMIFLGVVFLLLLLSLVPLLIPEEGMEAAKVFGRGAGALLMVLVVIVLVRAAKSFRAASKIEEGKHT